MKYSSRKRLPLKILVMYMISALLFLSSTELHIHTHEAAATADHGFAFSFTSLSDKLVSVDTSNEIDISPDGMLKLDQSSPSILAIIILFTLLIATLYSFVVFRVQEKYPFFRTPFFGTPSLRAPPIKL